ncbi:MAG: ABC-F family ATP-binding cassette domain-containing protein [Bacteroidota bacterium]
MIDFINVSIHYTGEDLFDCASFKINKGDKIALVGSNGCGKTALLKLIYGVESPTSGTISRQNKISIGFLPQEFINTSIKSLFDEVRSSMTKIIELEKIEEEIHETINNADITEDQRNDKILKLGEIAHKKEELDYYSVDSRIEKILMGLGFDEAKFGNPVKQFSGGWQMRIELAKILLGSHDIILLDEPTNHLDIDSLQWLINFLSNYNGALMIVSHDRYFVNMLTSRTLEIFNTKLTFFDGNYDKYLKLKEERDRQLLSDFKNQERVIKATESFIERFRYKATKARQVQSRIKQLEKIERIELPDFEKNIDIKFPDAPNCSALQVEVENVSKSYGANLVFQNANLQIERGDKIAFVGPNGAGKTTFAKILAKKTNYDSGKILIGTNVLISYYAQEVTETLDLSKDILDTLAESAPDYTPGKLRALLGSFLFTDDDVFKKIGVLSGGEKSRVALAKILLRQSNLIILDEPTNHLDHDSKKILHKALMDFKGSLIIVSHDIDFIRPLVNKVLELNKTHVNLTHGGIDYYLEKKADASRFGERNAKSNSGKKVDKKDLRRIEAELRQSRFKATKNIRQVIEKLEAEIERLEALKDNLEKELSDPKIFSIPEFAKAKNFEYDKIKSNLNNVYSKWTEKSEKLESIEKQFL